MRKKNSNKQFILRKNSTDRVLQELASPEANQLSLSLSSPISVQKLPTWYTPLKKRRSPMKNSNVIYSERAWLSVGLNLCIRTHFTMSLTCIRRKRSTLFQTSPRAAVSERTSTVHVTLHAETSSTSTRRISFLSLSWRRRRHLIRVMAILSHTRERI